MTTQRTAEEILALEEENKSLRDQVNNCNTALRGALELQTMVSEENRKLKELLWEVVPGLSGDHK